MVLNQQISGGFLARFATAAIMLAMAPQCSPTLGTTRLGADWDHHNGSSDESAFSPLTFINRENIGRLGLVALTDLPGETSLEATPLAIDGRLYFTGSYGAVYAVEAQTGRLLWRHDPEASRFAGPRLQYIFGVNRGLAYGRGLLFLGTIDGRLIAIDARTGREAWSVRTVAQDSRQTITGAPRVFGDKVIIGNGGADWGARGYVTAYDIKTGRQLWRFHTVPGKPADDGRDLAMALAAGSWGKDHWRIGLGGGTVWDSMTYDAELNRIYIGVGNSSLYDPEVRDPGGTGDNLFLASIVALDADTGRYVWHYQVNPREAWDFKATTNMVLADITISGRRRKVLMQAPTNGFFYVLDREDGRLLSAGKVGKVTWASHIDMASGRPVEAPGIRYQQGDVTIWPSPLGTHNWQTMAYSPRSGLAYIPTMQIGARWRKVPGSGMPDMDLVRADADDGKGALLAYDPVAQKPRWKVTHASFWNGGVLATDGGIVFQGTGDGHFLAFDADSGRPLWRFDAGLGIIGAPISYRVGERQFVSILVGYGGATALGGALMNQGWKYGAQPRRLLTFALDGKLVLPHGAPADFTVAPALAPSFRPDPRRIAAGGAVYARCALCHGRDLASSGLAPDLRESQAALEPETLRAIVKDGVLEPGGMPRFPDLTDEQMTDLYHFIRAGANAAAAGETVRGKSHNL